LEWYYRRNRLITRIEGLEKFLNLHRNAKYKGLEINWKITFNYLNINEELETYFKTNAASSKRKRMKVQRLIEEILSIKQMKKLSYDLYRSLLYPICHKKKESFIHVWTCRHNRKLVKNIIKATVEKLIDILRKNEVNILIINKQDFLDLSMFQRTDNTNDFSFIDMIKGIFPLCLYNLINFLLGTNKQAIAINVATELLNFIFDETNKKIWQVRCEAMKALEKSIGITKKDKNCPDILYNREKQREIKKIYPNNIYPMFNGLEGIREHILFGKKILGFMVNVIQVGKLVFI
jgi:hypothetical protein